MGAAGVLAGIVEMTPEAVATMHRAGAGGDQQRPAVVLVQHAVAGGTRVVADGIPVETGDLGVLVGDRQDLAQQRIVRVAPAHPGEIAARHAQAEQRRRRARGGATLDGQFERVVQGVDIGDGLAHRLLPAGRALR